MSGVPQPQQPVARNVAETALEAGKELARRPIGSLVQDAKPFVILLDKAGAEFVQYLDQRFDAPARKSGLVALHDEASFIEYWKAQRTDASRIYATLTPARFLAVFDDHTTVPAYRGHRAEYVPAFSREWKTWTEKSKQPFKGNEEFALWLEDQLPDISHPDGSKMMEIAINFRVNQNAAFSNAIRLDDGNTELTYTNTVEASARSGGGGKVKIPEEFVIAIPVFDGLSAPKYEVRARFRYRLQGGLSIWYELIRPHKVVEEAFQWTLATITKEAKATVLFGSPEK